MGNERRYNVCERGVTFRTKGDSGTNYSRFVIGRELLENHFRGLILMERQRQEEVNQRFYRRVLEGFN